LTPHEQQTLHKNAKAAEPANKKLFKQLKQKTPANLDQVVHELHKEAFAQIDCTTCANCCKTTSPRFLPKDIERLARLFKMSPGQFIAQYLQLDSDGDYVLQTAPCPFLAPDNLCMVYDHRPTACREYPHTNDRKFHRHFNITLHNTFICPAVFRITEKLRKIYSHNNTHPNAF